MYNNRPYIRATLYPLFQNESVQNLPYESEFDLHENVGGIVFIRMVSQEGAFWHKREAKGNLEMAC